MNKSKFLKNVVFGFGGQLIIIVLGIIIPRIMITSYGSDINGLTSTVTQIFTYMALLEAGIGQAAKNALYKLIANNDHKGISYVASVARRYFRKITIIYAAGVILLAILAPFLLKTNVNYITVFLIVFLEGMSGVITFYYVQTQTTILAADGRGYINSGVSVLNKTSSYIARIVMAKLGINIVFLQMVYFLISTAKSVYYSFYFKKHYSWINYNSAPKTAKLKDRNTFIITELTWTIFSSTDMIVLSVFVSTQMSSVYGVYNMIFSNINILLNVVYVSLNYMLGQTFHKDIEKYKKTHDIFTSIFLGGMTILMCICYILAIPFIKLYTYGISDVNYVYESLPVMFCLVQILSWSRYISGNLIGVAGLASKAIKVNIIEAILNLTLSLILVNQYGIVGVLFATVIALPLKVIYCNYISDRVILKRNSKKTISILLVNYLFFFAVVVAGKMVIINIKNYFDFAKFGLLFTILFGVIGIGLNCIANPECFGFIIKLITKGKIKNE